MVVRTLLGLVLGIALFVVGIPTLQSVVKNSGYYDRFTYEQAVMALLLVLASVIAVQLTGVRPPRDRD